MAEKEPTRRALQQRLNRARDRIAELERANENLLSRLEQVMELFRQDMGFTDEYPPTKEAK